jgi:hypothetical protein
MVFPTLTVPTSNGVKRRLRLWLSGKGLSFFQPWESLAVSMVNSNYRRRAITPTA